MDADRLHLALRAELARSFRDESSALDDLPLTAEAVGGLVDGELAGLLRARTRAVAGLVERIKAAMRAESTVPLVVVDISGGLPAAGSGGTSDATAGPAATRAWRDGVDLTRLLPHIAGVAGRAYAADVATFTAEAAAYRTAVPAGHTLALAVRPMLPDCRDPDNLRRKVAAAHDQHVDWLDFYHYGFAPLTSLDWIHAALAALKDERR